MSMKIKTEKIIVRGEQLREIKSYGLLKKDELPEIYFEDNVNYCFMDTDGELGFHSARKGTKYYSPGERLQEVAFQLLLSEIKICRTRLQKINARLAKENADWHGEETFVI